MRKRAMNVAAVCGVALAASLPAWSAQAIPGEASRTAPEPRAKVAGVATIGDVAALIALPMPAASLQKSAAAPAEGDGARQIGFAREVAPAEASIAAAAMRWAQGAGGEQVGRLAVRSASAASMRVAFALRDAPAGTTLRFVSRQSGGVIAVAAQEAMEATRASGLYWSPITAGDEQVIEVAVPAGAPVAQLRWSVEAVSHLVADPGTAAPALPGAKASSSCQLDVACVPPSPAFVQAMRSVAKIVYTVNGMTYTCTGTLVNDSQAATQIPYVLTAKHCIDSAAAAATVNTFWFLEASSCGSKSALAPTQLTRGARLLYAGAMTDVALLRLNEPAPAGAWFSGIDATPMAAGDGAIALHHPQGDLKKVSSGRVVNAAEGAAGRLVSMSWLSGTTEPGSSGSGLFTERNGQYLLRATLRGGSASCSNSGRTDDPSNRDYYTRLDADLGALEALLRAPAAPLEDYTDLWVVDQQPGTGVSITQHASNATFLVWFAYDASGRPTWITMPGGTWTSSTTYSGGLYRTHRPPGTQVGVQPVGSATITFSDASHATLAYTLDGESGSLALQRQVF